MRGKFFKLYATTLEGPLFPKFEIRFPILLYVRFDLLYKISFRLRAD
jgi:hypothetical protein